MYETASTLFLGYRHEIVAWTIQSVSSALHYNQTSGERQPVLVVQQRLECFCVIVPFMF